MSLQELPVELLHRIYDHCDERDVANFRLVSRLLATVGSEHILPEAFAHVARESFDNISAIARSTVAKGVRSLCFYAARLDDLQTFDRWDEERRSSDPHAHKEAYGLLDLDYRRERTPPEVQSERSMRRYRRNLGRSINVGRGHYSKPALLSAFKAYQQLYADQKCLRREGLARKAFAALFRSCTKLDTVTLTMANELRITKNHGVKAFRKAMIYPFSDNHARYYAGVHALESVLLGAHDGGRSIRRLAVQPVAHTFFELPPPVAKQIYEVAAGIKELHIGLESVFDDRFSEANELIYERMMYDLKSHKVAEFVQAATNLTTLSIGGPLTLNDLSNVHLHCLVGAGSRWQHLSTLALRMFSCTDTELDALLFSHRSTLRRLELDSAHFTEGTWEGFLERIAGKLDALRTMRFREELSSDTEGIYTEFMHEYYGGLRSDNEDSDDSVEEYGDSEVEQWTAAMESYIVKGGESMPRPEDFFDLDNLDMDW
ncbi:hypothetical protein LTR56_019899 [Elasticomyces elasticus]|nr:hypothetical protein LTR56_019899 [Elasticomyces elasticus]KAK3642351.1 hypothetical protein LTR22_016166 [Elasticomyces elasticus]KAK4914427.1 hypothetical protein LTR49_017347 [Elasticomyces elasticus]KAK5760403.1 hypothetical protein LTS12_009447 [Elasticomyces elasticus]